MKLTSRVCCGFTVLATVHFCACAPDNSGPTKGDGYLAGDPAGGSGGAAGTGGTAGSGGASGAGGSGGSAGSPGDANGSGSGDYHIPPVTAAEACNQLTQMFCDSEQFCCSQGNRKYASASACFSGEIVSCKDAAFTDSRTAYNPIVAAERIGQYREMASTCDLGAVEWAISEAGFFGMFDGTVGNGGSCKPNSATDTPAGLSCQDPYVCVFSSPLAASCKSPVANAGSCSLDLECAPGLRCDPPDSLFIARGHCAARLGNSSPCTRNGDCQSLNCAGLTTCAAASADSVYCID